MQCTAVTPVSLIQIQLKGTYKLTAAERSKWCGKVRLTLQYGTVQKVCTVLFQMYFRLQCSGFVSCSCLYIYGCNLSRHSQDTNGTKISTPNKFKLHYQMSGKHDVHHQYYTENLNFTVESSDRTNMFKMINEYVLCLRSTDFLHQSFKYKATKYSYFSPRQMSLKVSVESSTTANKSTIVGGLPSAGQYIQNTYCPLFIYIKLIYL